VGVLVNKQAPGVERFAVQLEQVQLLHRVLQHAPGSFGCQAFQLAIRISRVTDGRVLAHQHA
jgi:hypothetical protein